MKTMTGAVLLVLVLCAAATLGVALGIRLLRDTSLASRVFAVAAVVIGLVGVYAYVDAAFLHPDAQGGLVFLFMPLVQWIAVMCLLAVCVGLRHWSRRAAGPADS